MHANFRTARIYNIIGIASLSLSVTFALAGCKSSSNAGISAPIVAGSAADPNSPDPAAANVASGGTATTSGNSSGSTQVMGTSSSYQPQQQSESYSTGQQPAPIVRGSASDTQSSAADQNYAYNAPQDPGYADQASPQADDQPAYAEQAPPPLPEYDQPPAPEPDYLWTPGYWGYTNAGYYWIPGAWCPPPYYGALWTPPYWGFYGGRYAFHHGYWGPHIGFYGGIDYGFGYVGHGYYGGYWQDRHFYYNRSVTNVNINIVHNVYQRNVIINNVHYGPNIQNRISYNGGRGGLDVRPQPFELAARNEHHTAPVQAQIQVRQAAVQNHQQFFNQNHGRPAEAVIARPVVSNARIAEPPPAAAQQIQRRDQTLQQQQHAGAEPQRAVEPQRGTEAPTQRGGFQQQHEGPVGVQPQHGQPQQAQPQRGVESQPQRNVQSQQVQTNRSVQPQPQHTVPNQVQPQRTEPQVQHTQPQTERAQPQVQQPRPQPQAERPQTQVQQPQAQRVQPQPQVQRPQPQTHSAPTPHAAPAPAAHPAPAPHTETPHEEGHPKL